MVATAKSDPQVAKQLVIGEIGVIAASRELGHLRHEVEPPLANVLVTFTAIDSETHFQLATFAKNGVLTL